MPTSQSASAPVGHDEKLLQGRYRVTRCLGSGGMGDVFLAEDLRLQRLVAIKSLKQEFCKMGEVRKRIERECIMHAQLGAHPNIITLYDRVEEEGQIHLIIEFIDGTTLKDVIEQARLGTTYLTWRESVSIACQLLEALAKIHAHGIVHRDVKPANVMLTQTDTGAYIAKMMDFGISRLLNPVDGATMLTREGGSGPGTPIYMSPEQIAGTQFGPLSAASDIYAMGVVLYQMLAKRPPFQGTITDIFHGHLNAAPPPIDAALDATYPTQLTEVVLKALAKQPSNRFATAVDFRQALKRLSKAHGAITTLAVANTVASSGTVPVSPQVITQPPVLVAEPVTTSGFFMRRNDGAKTASRTVMGVAFMVAAVVAVLAGNFWFFRSLGQPDGPVSVPQQTVTGTAASVMTVPQPQSSLSTPPPVTPAVNTAAPQPVIASPPVTPEQPATPEQPPVAEVKEAPKTVAKKAAAKPKQEKAEAQPLDDLNESSSGEPKESTPVPVQQFTPEEEPRRTPIPVQTPVPDVSPPSNFDGSFSERARRPAQEMTPTPIPRTPPPNANIFQDIQVNKRPTIRVN